MSQGRLWTSFTRTTSIRHRVNTYEINEAGSCRGRHGSHEHGEKTTIKKIATATVQANFHWTYVRVYTDADGGLHGTGECFFCPRVDAHR